MTSEGRCTPGGPLTVKGIDVPTTPVIHRGPTARERAEKKDKK